MMRRGSIFSKYLMLSLTLILLMSQGVYAQETNTENQESNQVEYPSEWAAWEVQMASTYGFGTSSNYVAYTKDASVEDFLSIEASLEGKLQVKDTTKISGEFITRGQVLLELYDIMVLSLDLQESTSMDEVLNYYVSNSLINGREDNNYALEANCTKQELLAFSKRVYEYIIYSLGQESKGAFWSVSDGDNTVYLLGSIHITDDETYPLSQDLLTAFRSSSALVVEANTLVSNPEDTAYIQQIMMLEGEDTIDMYLDEATYDSYVEYVEALGLTSDIYNKLKPWYAAILVQSTSLQEADYSAAMGIDMYFQYLAYGNIPIMEVEGVKYQIDLFDSFSPELQAGYLMSLLPSNQNDEQASDAKTQSDESTSEEVDTDDTQVEDDTLSDIEIIGDLLSAWKAGDTETIEAIVFAEEDISEIEKEFYAKLFDERNSHMTQYVLSLLEDSENDYFFVVGAGHMLNDNGIVEELKAMGYDLVKH